LLKISKYIIRLKILIKLNLEVKMIKYYKFCSIFQKGHLIICPTPIGNLRDISVRQYETLQNADILACEDTRRTGMLIKMINEKNILNIDQEIIIDEEV
jgi:hypothetical protein